jgi:hypothetical protein
MFAVCSSNQAVESKRPYRGMKRLMEALSAGAPFRDILMVMPFIFIAFDTHKMCTQTLDYYAARGSPAM